MTDISAKLQHLVDRQEILDCIHRYTRALDRHYDDLLTSVFHDDAVDNHGRWVGGRTEFVQWANHECHSHLHGHMHHITSHTCEIDGSTAHTESYVLFVHRYKDDRTVHVAGGRYIDRLEKRDGDWRIAVRRLILDYRYVADGSVFGEWDGYPKGTQDASDISYSRPLEVPPELLATIGPGIAMIKFVAPALRHPANRPLPEFHRYWAESHGPLFANTARLRRYVQHLTLPDAYGGDLAPTYDGVSMFWFDEFEAPPAAVADQELADLFRAVLGIAPAVIGGAAVPAEPQSALVRAVLKDDAQLFDRSLDWPMHHKRAAVAAHERVIIDGAAAPGMVKAIFIVSKLPGLTLAEFFDRWREDHGRLAAAVPGLRRYVQNHAIPEAYGGLDQTHDGWSELWFDDLGALRSAIASPEWDALREHARMLFAAPAGVGVARERVQKEFGWTYRDWGVGAMDAEAIRDRLRAQGYDALAADPAVPATLKRAAANEALAVWTDEHLVTIDASSIDARPTRLA